MSTSSSRWLRPLVTLALAAMLLAVLAVPASAKAPLATVDSVTWESDCDASYDVTVKRGGRVKQVTVQLTNWSGDLVSEHSIPLSPKDPRTLSGRLEFGNGAGNEFLYRVSVQVYGGGGRLLETIDPPIPPLNSFLACGLPV